VPATSVAVVVANAVAVEQVPIRRNQLVKGSKQFTSEIRTLSIAAVCAAVTSTFHNIGFSTKCHFNNNTYGYLVTKNKMTFNRTFSRKNIAENWTCFHGK
jgi:hypothetical protein